MTSSASPPNGNVIPLRPPAEAGDSSRAQAALFIAQISLELEQLANTTGMELVSYFLAMARQEAQSHIRAPSAPAKPFSPQAPYRVD